MLLLDEPFGALDARVRQELRKWLDELHREIGVTSLLVTHDQDEALELANQVIVMHEGRIEQMGTPDEIYHQPATPFVAGFVGSANVLLTTSPTGTSSSESTGWAAPGISRRASRPRRSCGRTTCGSPIRPINGNSVTATVERVSSLGWLSRVILRLPDGQVLTAELPSEELAGIELGDDVGVDLRNAKAFRRGEAPPVGDLADSVIAGNDIGPRNRAVEQPARAGVR